MATEAKKITTRIRSILAENVRKKMNELYPLGPRYRSPTAQRMAMAAHAKISPRTIKEILDASRGTSIDNVEKLAGNVFHCPPHELLRE